MAAKDRRRKVTIRLGIPGDARRARPAQAKTTPPREAIRRARQRKLKSRVLTGARAARGGLARRGQPAQGGGLGSGTWALALGVLLGGLALAGVGLAVTSSPPPEVEAIREASAEARGEGARADPSGSEVENEADRLHTPKPEEEAAFEVALLETEVEALLARDAIDAAADLLARFPRKHRGRVGWRRANAAFERALARQVNEARPSAGPTEPLASGSVDPSAQAPKLDPGADPSAQTPKLDPTAQSLRPPSSEAAVRAALAARDYVALDAMSLDGALGEDVRLRLEALETLDAVVTASHPRLDAAPLLGGARVEVISIGREGVATSSGLVLWSALPSLSAAELFETTRLAAAAPLGHVLLCHDLGLRRRADGALLAAIEAGDVAEADAWALHARALGQAAPQGGFSPHEGFLVDARLARGLIHFGDAWLTKKQVKARVSELRPTGRRAKAAARIAREAARDEAKALFASRGVTSVTTPLRSGDSAKRVDIVFVSDGFSREERGAYEAIVDRTSKGLLRLDPYRNYAHYVNVHRVTVADEARSGTGATRLRTKVESAGGGILTSDIALARQYARLAPDADLVIVVCNIKNVRATGGSGVITIDASGDIGDVVIHELGHAFGGLDDEYVDASVASRFAEWEGGQAERRHVNTSRVGDPGLVKWHYWTRRPLPSPKVGVYEGAYYRRRGYFRASAECRMRSSSTKRTCAVCLERLERRFYRLLAPIDAVEPQAARLGLFLDEKVQLSATAVKIEGQGIKGGFSARWYLDGARLEKGVKSRHAKSGAPRSTLSVPARTIGPGEHEVALRVSLTDSRIRRSWGSLASTRCWRVRIYPTKAPRLRAPKALRVSAGEPIDARVEVRGQLPPGFRIEAKSLPLGATFTQASTNPAEGGALRWTPGPLAAGAHRVVLSLTDGLRSIEGAVDVDVSRAKRARKNGKPLVVARRAVAREGEELEVRIGLFDPDGDHVRLSAEGLPAGARLDPSSGVLRWRPNFSASADLRVALVASDGRSKTKAELEIHVEDRATASPRALRGFDIIYALRSTQPRVRRAGLARLETGGYGQSFLALEASRLLLDPDPSVSAAARGAIGRAGRVATGASRQPDEEPRAAVDVRLMILDDLAERLWELTDSPEGLALAERLAEAAEGRAAKGAAKRILEQLAAIRRYNRERGAD